MNTDIWYDLAIRELSDLSDPAKEKLAEAAAETLAAPDVEAEEEAALQERLVMRRWILGTAVALIAVMPAGGYAQTPSGEKTKDDSMKMEKMDKK
ncbi:MAG TPA: hypothetical protein VFO08_13300 [Methylomirabilota bacterium]|nr:hypothetical protein [Methylomirabilota bacterium]